MLYSKLQMILRLLTCALMLLAVAIQYSGRIAGHTVVQSNTASDTIILSGTQEIFVIDTRKIASDIKGYGGNTPLRITVNNGRVYKIDALKNAETPEFFSQVEDKVLQQYIGMTPEEVLQSKIDAVSGATLSSRAAIETMQRGMEYAINQNTISKKAVDRPKPYSVKLILSLSVVLMGAVLPLITKNKRYRIVQLILNVLLLGFWSGTFISYSLIINYLANGINVIYSIIPIIMLITAFIYPFFGKKSHYCMWQCPFGSLQELAGKCIKYKWKLSPKTLTILDRVRDGLWALLMLLMWSGVCFEWMNYEPFSAFIFTKASWVATSIALAFVALSFVINRPYCRFVCPTGNLFRIVQNK